MAIDADQVGRNHELGDVPDVVTPVSDGRGDSVDDDAPVGFDVELLGPATTTGGRSPTSL
jgi:hypothetical protein